MSPDQYNKLKANIEETGKYPSLIALKTDNRYILLDGHNRLECIKELKHKEAWCEPWEVTDKQADIILATMNRLRGTDDVHMRGKLISRLHDQFEGDKAALLRLLPETEKSLNAILKMAMADLEEKGDILEDEKEMLRVNLEAVMDPEEADRISKMYKNDDGKPRMTFVFGSERDYYSAVRYFGRKNPNVKKLLRLIGHG